MKAIFHEIEKAGARLFLLDGALKLSALPGTVSPDVLARIRKRKAEIITLFTTQQRKVARVEQEPVPILDGLHPCQLCGGVLFNEGSKSGYFCAECQTLPEGANVLRVVRGITPRRKDHWNADVPGWIPSEESPSPVKSKAKKTKPSPFALEWLAANRAVLRAQGWTPQEIYRANRSKGIAWGGIWNKEALEISIKNDGVIIFQYFNNIGKAITQTARPMQQRNKITKN